MVDLNSKDFLTPKELDLLYGLSVESQANRRSKKQLPYIKVFGKIMYDHKELKEFFRSFAIKASL